MYNAQRLDFSDKLLEVKSVKYQYGDWAQSNTIEWAQDEAVLAGDVGVLVCENKTLAGGKKMVEMALATCDAENQGAGRAALRIYEKISEMEGQGDDARAVFKGAKLVKVKPRIVWDTVEVDPVAGRRIGKVVRLSGEEGLIESNYKAWGKVMRRPVVVVATMMLTPGDLAQLDLMVPVFVEQLHGVFALMAVSVKGGGCEVEMLRL